MVCHSELRRDWVASSHQEGKTHKSGSESANLCYYLYEFQGVELAKKFEQMVLSDERFEVPAERHMGMVVFRMKGENEKTEKLLKKLNRSGH